MNLAKFSALAGERFGESLRSSLFLETKAISPAELMSPARAGDKAVDDVGAESRKGFTPD